MAGAELIGKEEIKEVMDVLGTGIFARYAFDNERKGIWKVRDFEHDFAKYTDAKYALGVTSGSAALKVALTALDVGPGDEVICPAFTFMATYEAVLEVGGIPVMADIDDTLNLDPDDITNKITSRTKAVIPVHMCGAPARIDRIMKVAKKNKLLVLEDNAQGCGASYKGKMLGSFGHMGIFSFDHYKTITTGEGGMIITNDLDLYHRAEIPSDPRSRCGFGNISGLQSSRRRADESLPEGAQGRRNRYDPLQGQFLALCPQLGTLPREIHGPDEESLQGSPESESDVQPEIDPSRGGSPRPDPHYGSQRDNAGREAQSDPQGDCKRCQGAVVECMDHPVPQQTDPWLWGI